MRETSASPRAITSATPSGAPIGARSGVSSASACTRTFAPSGRAATIAGRRGIEQRESERARYAEITARKTEYRCELRENGLAPQIATSLAAFRAAQERSDLRDTIVAERTKLKRDLQLEPIVAGDIRSEHFVEGNPAPRFWDRLSGHAKPLRS